MTKMRRPQKTRVCSLLIGAALIITACDPAAQFASATARMTPSKEGAGRTAEPGETFPSFPDIPVASGSRMNVNKTVVLGGDEWFGQLSIAASHGAHVMFEFYRNQLPKYGWGEISAVRAPTSVLTYDRGVRVLALQITGNSLGGSELTISVAPRGGAGAGQVLQPPAVAPPAASGDPLAQPVQPLPPLTKSN